MRNASFTVQKLSQKRILDHRENNGINSIRVVQNGVRPVQSYSFEQQGQESYNQREILLFGSNYLTRS